MSVVGLCGTLWDSNSPALVKSRLQDMGTSDPQPYMQQAFSYPKDPTGQQHPWFGGSLRVQLCKADTDSRASGDTPWKPLPIHKLQTRCDTTILPSPRDTTSKPSGPRSKTRHASCSPVKIQTDVTWGFVESEPNTRFAIQVDYLSRLGLEAKSWKIDDWVELSIFFDGAEIPDISTCKILTIFVFVMCAFRTLCAY